MNPGPLCHRPSALPLNPLRALKTEPLLKRKLPYIDLCPCNLPWAIYRKRIVFIVWILQEWSLQQKQQQQKSLWRDSWACELLLTTVLTHQHFEMSIWSYERSGKVFKMGLLFRVYLFFLLVLTVQNKTHLIITPWHSWSAQLANSTIKWEMLNIIEANSQSTKLLTQKLSLLRHPFFATASPLLPFASDTSCHRE